MNGVHDIGGIDGFGAVEVEADEPTFHHEWERRVFGCQIAISLNGLWPTSHLRHAIERMDPLHYLASSYYEHWLTQQLSLLIEQGHVTEAELVAHAGGPLGRVRPARAEAPADPGVDGIEPRFAVGDAVRVLDWHPLGHCRVPRYVKGKRGVVAHVDAAWPVPDIEAHAEAAPKEPTYSVRFEATELWGSGAGPAEAMYVDLWDRYLGPIEESG